MTASAYELHTHHMLLDAPLRRSYARHLHMHHGFFGTCFPANSHKLPPGNTVGVSPQQFQHTTKLMFSGTSPYIPHLPTQEDPHGENKEYDYHSHIQCQLFTPTTSTSILTTPLYPDVFSLSFNQKMIQLPSGSEIPMMNLPHSMIQTPLLPHHKTRLALLWDQDILIGQSARNLWATSPPGSNFNSSHIMSNKVVSSFKSLLEDDFQMIGD
ncbi:hypothetical protein O181_024316 [Austropuccinia psidii MF-1]|uniref:Uncharacterized protein n=1 Tax=Austropuccinia psidii MF-1 TaxID=1389203 RepID=A0A9Q3GYI5_9BASI|nr:hypothetical protein [Austropuccinia psidii MF-1]